MELNYIWFLAWFLFYMGTNWNFTIIIYSNSSWSWIVKYYFQQYATLHQSHQKMLIVWRCLEKTTWQGKKYFFGFVLGVSLCMFIWSKHDNIFETLYTKLKNRNVWVIYSHSDSDKFLFWNKLKVWWMSCCSIFIKR